MDTLPGAIGLLAGAVSYMLGVCAPLGPEEMALPTPCPHRDLARLLSHLCESMADLEAGVRTARPGGPPGRGARGRPRRAAVRRLLLRRPGALRDGGRPADPSRRGRLHRGGGDRGARLGRLGGPRPGWPPPCWR